MRVTINNIERECQVCSVQRGTYTIYNFKEGGFFFPDFLIISPSITEHEKACGQVVVCPVVVCNGGYEEVCPGNLHSYLNLKTLKGIINNLHLALDGDLIDEAETIINDFVRHGTSLSKEVQDYIDFKYYITDEDIRRSEPYKNIYD